MCVCVCVCVCERERASKGGGERNHFCSPNLKYHVTSAKIKMRPEPKTRLKNLSAVSPFSAANMTHFYPHLPSLPSLPLPLFCNTLGLVPIQEFFAQNPTMDPSCLYTHCFCLSICSVFGSFHTVYHNCFRSPRC